jgi:hypothetical protein
LMLRAYLFPEAVQGKNEAALLTALWQGPVQTCVEIKITLVLHIRSSEIDNTCSCL